MLIKEDRLKKILLDAELLNQDQIKRAEKFAKDSGEELEDILVEKDFISDEYLGRLIAEELELNFVNLRNERIEKKVLNIIPEIVAEKQRVIAFRQEGSELLLAMAEPNDLSIIKMIEKKTG